MNSARLMHVHPSLFAAARALEEALHAQESRVLGEPSHITYRDWLGLLARALGLPEPAKDSLLRLVLEDLLAAEAAQSVAPVWDAGAALELFAALDLTPYGALARPWPLTGAKARALWRLYGTFETRRKRLGLILEGDLWRALLAAPAKAVFRKDDTVHFVDLLDLPPLRFVGLQALARRTTLQFSYHWQAGVGAWFSALETLLGRFEAQDAICSEALHFLPLPYGEDPCLPALFGATGESRVTLLRPADRRQEVRHLAEALAAALQEGYAPQELAVVAPDVAAIQPFLRQALLEEGLPLSYSRSLPLLGAPSLAWLGPLARLAEGETTREELGDLVRGLAPYGLSPLQSAAGALERAEIFWSGQGIRYLGAWREGGNGAAGLAADEANAVSVYDACADFLAGWRNTQSLGTWLLQLRALLDTLRLVPYQSADDARHFVYAYQAVKTLRGMLAEWGEGGYCDLSRPLTPSEFFAWLTRGASQDLRLRTPAGPEQIAVLSPEDAICGSYRRVYLLDCLDGLWPSGGTRLAYLCEAERELLRHDLAASLGKSEREHFLRQKQTLAALLLRCHNAVIYAPLKIEEEERALSPLLAHLLPAQALPLLPAKRALWRQHLESAWPQLKDDAQLATWPAAERATLSRRHFKYEVELGRRELALRGDDAPDSAAKARPYAAYLPATWIGLVLEFWAKAHSHGIFERYANCPFSLFAETFLAIKDEPAADFDLSPTDLGQAVHQCLERIYTHPNWRLGHALKEVEDAAYADLLASFSQLMAKKPRFARQSLPPRARQWAVRIRRVVGLQAETQAKASPLFFEGAFGRGGHGASRLLPELNIPVAQGAALSLLGRIDRIDRIRGEAELDTLALYDYKTSRSMTTYSAKLGAKHFGVDHFQLPIYLLALRAYLETEPELAQTVGRLNAGFWLIGSPSEWPKAYSWALSDAASADYFTLDPTRRECLAQENSANLANRLAQLFGAIQAGEFPAKPLSCTHCSYLDLCRFTEKSAEERSTEAAS